MTVVDFPLLPKTIRSTLAAPHRVRRQGLSLRTQRWPYRRLCAGSSAPQRWSKVSRPLTGRSFPGQVPSLWQAELDRWAPLPGGFVFPSVI
jgi:hypothetical protein